MPAVVLEQGRALPEYGAEDFQERVRRDARFACQGEGLAERFEHRDDDEVAGELDDVGQRRNLSQLGDAATEALKQRKAARHVTRLAGREHPQLLRGSGFWAPEHGRRDIALRTSGVLLRQAFGERDRNRTRRDVHGAARQAREDPRFTQGDCFDRSVVREHREHDLGLTGCLGRGGHDARAGLVQRLSAPVRAVVHEQLMPARGERLRHRQTHRTETHEANSHPLNPTLSCSVHMTVLGQVNGDLWLRVEASARLARDLLHCSGWPSDSPALRCFPG
jgi:hypothetical protein